MVGAIIIAGIEIVFITLRYWLGCYFYWNWSFSDSSNNRYIM